MTALQNKPLEIYGWTTPTYMQKSTNRFIMSEDIFKQIYSVFLLVQRRQTSIKCFLYEKKNQKVPVSKNINRIVSIMQICSRIDFLWNFHCYVFLLLSCYQQIWTNFWMNGIPLFQMPASKLKSHQQAKINSNTTYLIWKW